MHAPIALERSEFRPRAEYRALPPSAPAARFHSGFFGGGECEKEWAAGGRGGIYIRANFLFNSNMNGTPKLGYKDYIEGTRKVLDQSKQEKEPYTATVCGRDFVVFPNVFSPKYFHDTELFAENFPVRSGEVMLEIGPGTGAIAITAIHKGASKVVAIDINPDAVKNSQANIERHHMQDKIDVRQGDLYEPLRQDEKFDTICWNTPFGFVEDIDIPDLEKAVYDPQYKSTEQFIKKAKEHLNVDGRVLIGFSTTLGKLDLLQKFVDEAGLEMHLIYEVESKETHPVKFEIFEAIDKEL